MPISMRRPTRPSDHRLGVVYGADPHARIHTDGVHAGYTVVTVPAGHVVSVMQLDGWVAFDPADLQAPLDVPDGGAATELRDAGGALVDAPPGEVRDAAAVVADDPSAPRLDPTVAAGESDVAVVAAEPVADPVVSDVPAVDPAPVTATPAD